VYVVDDTCLPQPRYYSRAVFVEAVYPVGIAGGVALGLLDIVLLGLEEFTLLVRLSYAALHILSSYFEILLPARGFEESLAGMMFCPDLVTRVDLLRPDIAPSFLFVHPAVFRIAVFADPTWGTAHIGASGTLTFPSVTFQPVEVCRKTSNERVSRCWVDDFCVSFR